MNKVTSQIVGLMTSQSQSAVCSLANLRDLLEYTGINISQVEITIIDYKRQFLDFPGTIYCNISQDFSLVNDTSFRLNT